MFGTKEVSHRDYSSSRSYPLLLASISLDCAWIKRGFGQLHVSTSNSCACQLMELCFKIVRHPMQQTLKK